MIHPPLALEFLCHVFPDKSIEECAAVQLESFVGHKFPLSDDRLKLVELALKAGIAPEFPEGSEEALSVARTVLQRATRYDDARLVALLLAHGACPHREDYDGVSAIDAALDSGTPEVLALFLRHDITRDPRIIGPIATLVWEDQLDQLRPLLAQGAPINTPCEELANVLALARTPAMARLLLEAGIDPHQRNAQGLSALDQLQGQEDKQPYDYVVRSLALKANLEQLPVRDAAAPSRKPRM